jgi:hypothetical protein
MQFREDTGRPDYSHHHIVIRHDPYFVTNARPIVVPEGGSTLLFVLAALTAMGWAVSKRYRAGSHSAARMIS